MIKRLLPLLVVLTCSAVCLRARGANPFLAATDDKPVSARFTGTEWGDEIGSKDLPLGAKVVTRRIALAPWGSIFKISFEDIASRATPRRQIGPVYYIATDDEIILLNEEKPEAVAQKLAADAKPPTFDPNDVQGISKGVRKSAEGVLTETTITVKDDRCTYQWSHNSGHFTTIVWQKGVGLIEYAQGRGARADGYRLKRVGATAKKKG